MSDLRLVLSDDLRRRLEALSANLDQSMDECLQQAVREFVENWEDHLRVVAALQEDEARPILRAVAAENH